MNRFIVTAVWVIFALKIADGYEMTPEVENAMANDAWGGQREPALARNELKSHFLTNWRKIVTNIDVLPLVKFDQKYKEDRVLPSISMFIYDCEALEPSEYLDFLDQMLVLYEQKRISFDALDLSLGPALEKRDFLSVNYAHPRVAEILKKAIELTPPEYEASRSALEDTANGTLADNYMYNRRDEDPLPETLPGIKLKRPWGSIIRKYERITGKKVPPDPDFPEEAETHPKKRRSVTAAQNGFRDSEAPANTGSLSTGKWVVAGLACLAALAATVKIIRQRTLRK